MKHADIGDGVNPGVTTTEVAELKTAQKHTGSIPTPPNRVCRIGSPAMAFYEQLEAGVRFEWGLEGAIRLATTHGCLVIIDILSFTTNVSVAVSRGIEVFPYPTHDSSALAFAAQQGAVLAAKRGEPRSSPWSTSATTLLNSRFTSKLVLPSNNGSAISSVSEGLVVAGSLRNGSTVAETLLAAGFGTPSAPIVFIASGEQWDTHLMRPNFEDHLGAGMIIAQLMDSGCGVSVEAQAAASVFRSTGDIAFALSRCSTGKELKELGYENDVAIAGEVDADAVIPVLTRGAFSDGKMKTLRDR